jgi:DNA mismatch repair protein MutL
MSNKESKINLLPEEVYNKIAAGEVVQRPASVVKELVENSIDAGAKNITVIVKDAGKKLISVTDDGSGMTEDDLILSIKRHATSKIKSADDLETIDSFGFRGEALSSIAAVSQLEIKTRTEEDEVASRLYFTSEAEFETEKVAAPKGTTVSVKNLFYNVPARKNFLKSNSTELKNITNLIKYFALAYPEVSFKFFNEDKLQLNFISSNLNSRMKDVFGNNILDMVIETYEQIDFIELSGFIAKPTFLTDSRLEQHLFVNRRYVKSKSLSHAVFSAYQNILSKGEYPFFVLFLDIDPSRIDVNIHPTKQEIKFYDETQIYSFVNAVVKKSLGSYDIVPKTIGSNLFDSGERKSSGNRNEVKKKNLSSINDNELELLFGDVEKELSEAGKSNVISHPFTETKTKEVEHRVTNRGAEEESDRQKDFVVSLHDKYILTQIKSGLMVIDAHLAHIRILYEKALAALNTNMSFAQQLLFVQTFRISKEAYKVLQENDKMFSSIGFEIRYFSNSTISITGVPSDVKFGSEVKALMGILEDLLALINVKKEGLTNEKFAEIYSKHAALKIDSKMTQTQMKSLIDQLFATTNPYMSPCSKPIIVKIPLTEFDKKFGRM